MQCVNIIAILSQSIKKNLAIAAFFIVHANNVCAFDMIDCRNDMTSSYFEANEIFSGVIEKIVAISPVDHIASIKVYEFFKSVHEINKHHRYALIGNENKQYFANGREYLFYATRINAEVLHIPRCSRTNFLSNSTPDILTFYAKFLPRPHKKNSGIYPNGYDENSFMKAFRQMKNSIFNFFCDLKRALMKLLR